MDEESRNRLESNINEKPSLLCTLSLQNPRAVNPQLETESIKRQETSLPGPSGIYLLGGNAELEMGKGEGDSGKPGFLGLSPSPQKQVTPPGAAWRSARPLGVRRAAADPLHPMHRPLPFL